MKWSLFRRGLPGWWRKLSPWLLAFSWCFGLLLGSLIAHTASNDLISLMRGAIGYPVSILGLLISTVLPFLLSAYAVSISEPWLLLIFSTLKALGFGFCAWGVGLAFGSAAWLVRFLFLFSDVCLVPALYLFWLRHISGERHCARPEMAFWLVFAAAIGSIDHLIISPFLVRIIS